MNSIKMSIKEASELMGVSQRFREMEYVRGKANRDNRS